MNEQLSLFDEEFTEQKIHFWSYHCNDDWSVKTHTVGGVPGIVVHDVLELTKKELIEICKKAESSNKYGPYGYQVFYIEDGIKKELFVRFSNFKSRAKWSVIEFINLYFGKNMFERR